MKKISEVTRKDIIDIIMQGFIVKEPVDDFFLYEYECSLEAPSLYIVKMPFYGRISEIDFLSRLYNLDEMPSTDFRFKTARGDIYQHTVINDDWDSFWFFYDERFNLNQDSEDEPLLKFICEMFNPVVRLENKPWKEYVKKFNDILASDGYELYSVEGVSGRDIYKFREKDVIEIEQCITKRYSSLKSIGEGSYANVLKYKDDFYNKVFALKRAKSDLNEKELERFKREFEQMSKLNSPYVIEVYSYDEQKNEYTMEYMDKTLEKYISQNNSKISISQRLNIINQLIKGYKYIHSEGIFHRDVSFKNVLIKEFNDVLVVKISDFGLVKILDSSLTSENSELKGCLNDPSLRIRGFDKYDLLDEIYALTLLIAYILTGKTNFPTIKESCIQQFIKQGTDPVRNNRYQTLDELKCGVINCTKSLQENR